LTTVLEISSGSLMPHAPISMIFLATMSTIRCFRSPVPLLGSNGYLLIFFRDLEQTLSVGFRDTKGFGYSPRCVLPARAKTLGS
jgi:hypothetical protein